MGSNILSHLKTILGILSAFQIVITTPCGQYEVGPAGGPCVDMRWCLYKVNNQPMNWADARQICIQEGYDFLKITDAGEHSYLTSYLASSLSSAYLNPFDSTLWVGMQQVSGDLPRWHDDCSSQTAGGYSPAPSVPGSNCFMLDHQSASFTYDACSNSKMFICKAKTYDLNTCFESVATMSNAQFEMGSYAGMAAATSCAEKCSLSNHVGYHFDPVGSICQIATAMLGSHYKKGAERYMKDIVSTAVKAVNDPNAVTNEPCSSSVPVAITTTAAPEATTSAVPEATTSAVPEATTSAVPEATTSAVPQATTSAVPQATTSDVLGLSSFSVMPSSTIETSMAATNEETSSTETPQLSNTLTTVDLSTTSLSTESVTNLYTGTPSSSCYHCFCNSNLMTSLSPEQLQSQIETLKRELTVEKKELSSWKRKLISIPDERVSAKSLGYLGAAMLAVVFGAVVLIDLPRFMNGLKIFYHSVCNHKKISTIE
ncbi:mucin-17-like [Pecten maximus]|uniref:mucin-17-like n=1 Tax=Pecten maximus TaxID=6579 RepID=UPI001458AB78|nr:mucin-17-like [Pecten maximus]